MSRQNFGSRLVLHKVIDQEPDSRENSFRQYLGTGRGQNPLN